MRKGILGSIAALTAGAGMARGQAEPTAAGRATVGTGAVAAMAAAAPVVDPAVTPAAGPAPVIMPQLPGVPPGGPPGSGYDGGGPPPAPQYPPPGPYGAPLSRQTPEDEKGGVFLAPKAWTSIEYLLLTPRSQVSPIPLATTGPAGGGGVLGSAGTRSLIGGGPFSYDAASGFRATTGFFADPNRRFGLEASGFSVEPVNSRDAASVGAGAVLARPFVDAGTGLPSSLVLGGTGFGSATVTVDTSSRSWGVEGNGIVNLYRSQPGCGYEFGFDVLGGYRYFQLTETLDVTGTGSLAGAGAITATDSFRTRNRFNGGQLGGRTTFRRGMFSLRTGAKIAFGEVEQQADVGGAAQLAAGAGGLFTNAANFGRVSNDKGTYLAEFNSTLGVSLTQTVTATVGYNLMYVGDVLRPGGVLNPTVPGGNRLVQDDFLLDGVSFGLDLRY